jgi:SAM-dependent methyltransferase
MHERIITLYEENAAAWDEARGAVLKEQEWIDRFLAQVAPGGALLDLGCGSGRPVAAYLVERGYRVTGLDSSPSLIAMCRDRFPAEEWLVGDMRALDLGHRFDGILAWYSFFHLHFDDQRAMFPASPPMQNLAHRSSSPALPSTVKRSASGRANRSTTRALPRRNIAGCSTSLPQYRRRARIAVDAAFKLDSRCNRDQR